MKPVLLSPKELGYALGLSESTLKRWIDAGRLQSSRTMGGHRRVSAAEAIRFVREEGLSVVDPQALGLPVLPAVSAHDSQSRVEDLLVEALLDCRSDLARQYIMRLFLDGMPLAKLFDDTIQWAIEKLNPASETGAHDWKGMALQHCANDVCMQAISHIRSLLPEPSQQAPLAVLGSLPGDLQPLSLAMVATLLQERGWRTLNLGSNTPEEAFSAVLEDQNPRVLWLSCGKNNADAIGSLIKQTAGSDLEIWLGGSSASICVNAMSNQHVRLFASLSELSDSLANTNHVSA